MVVVISTILLDNHCINHVLHLFKRIVIDFFVPLAKKSIMNFLKEDYMCFVLHTSVKITVMKFVMSYSICQRKYLVWTVFDDNNDADEFIIKFKIREFRVCDCFLDWTTRFRNKNKNAVFSEEVIADFFDGIPTDATDCDIFSLFGKITIVCCRNALYHFFY